MPVLASPSTFSSRRQILLPADFNSCTVFTKEEILAGVGVRGPVGVQTNFTAQPAGSVEVLPGAGTIQAAVAANPINTTFWLRQGSYPITSEINPKLGQRFFGEKTSVGAGVSITRGGSIQYGIAAYNGPGNFGANDVVIKNIFISGFDGAGFANGAAITSFRPDRWEIANCDLSNNWWGTSTGGDATDQGNDCWVHHNYYHGTHFGAYTGQRCDGLRFEDNEITGVAEDGGQKTQKFLNTPASGGPGLTFAHNYIHDMAGHGFWNDSTCSKSVVEWNKIVTSSGGTSAAIEEEFNTWQEPFSDGLPLDENSKNQVRYNQVTGWNGVAVAILGSSWTEVFNNVFDQNLASVSTGEIQIELFQAQVNPGGQSGDIRHNTVAHNYIKPRSTKNAVYINCTTLDNGGGPYNRTYVINNTASNNFDFNHYENITATRTAFSLAGTNRTFGQWQTQVMQDGIAPGQDASSTRSDV